MYPLCNLCMYPLCYQGAQLYSHIIYALYVYYGVYTYERACKYACSFALVCVVHTVVSVLLGSAEYVCN
jgi:hypothetical protein